MSAEISRDKLDGCHTLIGGICGAQRPLASVRASMADGVAQAGSRCARLHSLVPGQNAAATAQVVACSQALLISTHYRCRMSGMRSQALVYLCYLYAVS